MTRLFLRQGLLPLAAGALAGVFLARAVAVLIANQVHGLRPGDPGTFFAAAAVLGTASVAAVWLPARRASRGPTRSPS